MLQHSHNEKLNAGKWLQREILLKKLVSPGGLIFLAAVALASAFLVVNDFFIIPFAAAAALLGIIVIYMCVFKPYIGYYLVSTFAIFVFYPNHLIGRDALPMSFALEILVIFVFLGSYISHHSDEKKGNLIKTLISIGLIINTAEVILQAFNPNVPGLDVWLPTIRSA